MDFKDTQVGRLLSEVKLAMIAHTPIINIVTDQLEVINQLLWDEDCADAIIPRVKYDSESGEYVHLSPDSYFQETPGNGKKVSITDNYYIGKLPKFASLDHPALIVNFASDWKSIKDSTTSFVKAYLGIKCDSYPVESNIDAIRRSVYIVVSPSYQKAPVDLLPYVCTITLPKMEDSEIAFLVESVLAENKIEKTNIPGSLFNQMIVNFRGFGRLKIKQVLTRMIALQYLDKSTIKPQSILGEIREAKKQLMEGCKGLKWENGEGTNVAGLNAITKWLEARAELFGDPEKAIKRHLDIPRGIIVAGIPGSGKSLMAKTAACILGLPLISLDMGALLGSLVGDSEHNMIEALQIAETMSPCVLWIDEIEKAFSGSSQNSSQSDGGVGRRMFGKFLTWMQEKSGSCFVFATSNDITSLPPELFRSERFDRKFFTFMPTAEECAKIFASNIAKQNQDYKQEISHLNFTQSLEMPEGLFDPELERSNFWLHIINDSCAPCGSSLSLEENITEDNSEKRYGWQNNKRPGYKLMTGADISALIKLAKFACYEENKKYDGATSNYIYDTGAFVRSIYSLLQSDDFKPYGETNLKDIVACFLKLYENQFSSASGDCIVEFDDYDADAGMYLHTEQKKLSHRYDQALYYAIVGAINHYVKPSKSDQ